jgi:lambda family phage tail tape measure protein
VTTLANLLFVADTKSLDDASKKLDKLATDTKKIPAVQVKADAVALSNASGQFSELSKTATVASMNVTAFGRSFDGLKGQASALGEIHTSVTGIVSSLLAGNTGGLAKDVLGLGRAFKALHTDGKPGTDQIKEAGSAAEAASPSILHTANSVGQLGAAAVSTRAALKSMAASTSFTDTTTKATAASKELAAATAKVLEAQLKHADATERVNRAYQLLSKTDKIHIFAGEPEKVTGTKPYHVEYRDAVIASQATAAKVRFAEMDKAAAGAGTAVAETAKISDAAAGTFFQVAKSVGAIYVAAIATAGALAAYSTKVALAADDQSELAEKLGLTVHRLQELTLVADENSGSVEGIIRTFDKLDKTLDKADGDAKISVMALAKLGTTIDEVNAIAKDDRPAFLIEQYEKLGKTSEATAALSAVLGQGWRENSVALKNYSSNIQDAADRITKYGAYTDKELIEKGGLAEKAISNLKLSFEGLSKSVAGHNDGAGTRFTQWLADSLNGARDFVPWLNKMADKMNSIALLKFTPTGIMGNLIRPGGEGRLVQGELDEAEAELARLKRPGRTSVLSATLAAQQAKVDALKARLPAPVESTSYDDILARRGGDAARITAQRKADALKKAEEDRRKKEEKPEDPLAWMKEPAYIAVLDKARLRSAEKNADYDAAEKAAFDDKIKGYAEAHKAYEQEQKDLQENQKSLKEKADAIRAQIDPNFTIMKQLKEISELEKNGSLSATEAAKARLALTVQLQGEQATFIDGWKNAFQQYRDSAQTAAGAAADIFKTATSGMEEAIVNFAMTGSLGFAKFTQSILASMVQIAARRAALGLVELLGNAFFAGGGSPTGGSGTIGPAQPSSNFWGSNVKLAAGGDVSAGMGAVVGENGPEVLRMGVLGGHVFPNTASSGGVNIQGGINVSVTGGTTNEQTGEIVSRSILNTMRDLARDEMKNQKRPGGLLYGGI